MANHLISTQTLDITFLNQPQEREVLAWLNTWFEGDFCPALEKLFDRFGTHQIIRLDRIEIDVGRIQANNWQQRLTEQVLAQLAEQLTNVSFPTTFATSSTSEPQADELQAFAHFLQKATLPWFWQDKKRKTLDEWLAQLIAKQPSALKTVLVTLFESPAVVQRFVLQFSWQRRIALLTLWGVETEAEFKVWKLLFDWVLTLNSSQREAIEITLWQEIIRQPTEKNVKLLGALFQKIIKQLPEKHIAKALASLKERLVKNTLINLSQWSELTEELQTVSLSQNVASEPELTKEVLDAEAMFVANAGLCLLRPFLRAFLTSVMGEQVDWTQMRNRCKAAQVLHYVCTGKVNAPEYELTFNKILCDVPLQFPIANRLYITPLLRQETKELLQTVISHWAVLKETSVQNLRASFLMRAGSLRQTNEQINLFVERKAYDALLEQLPWGYHTCTSLFENRYIEVTW